jgi:hypothetical protein
MTSLKGFGLNFTYLNTSSCHPAEQDLCHCALSKKVKVRSPFYRIVILAFAITARILDRASGDWMPDAADGVTASLFLFLRDTQPLFRRNDVVYARKELRWECCTDRTTAAVILHIPRNISLNPVRLDGRRERF